jgi:ABC-type transporter Mla maintaining outer membrane lipid asymmetry permease subunit MlaE
MASIDRGIELSGWSDDLRDMIRRRISESGGVALITLSALIAVALATWSVQDPSLSHATDGPVRNYLGTAGAVGNGIVKSAVFGVICTFVALYQGYETQATPEGVAYATTRTVVVSSLAVLGMDFILTALMFSTP